MDLDTLKAIDLSQIETLEQSKALNIAFLNLIEKLLLDNEILKKQLEELKDEINRLKGEQGRPTFNRTKNLSAREIKKINSEK